MGRYCLCDESSIPRAFLYLHANFTVVGRWHGNPITCATTRAHQPQIWSLRANQTCNVGQCTVWWPCTLTPTRPRTRTHKDPLCSPFFPLVCRAHCSPTHTFFFSPPAYPWWLVQLWYASSMPPVQYVFIFPIFHFLQPRILGIRVASQSLFVMALGCLGWNRLCLEHKSLLLGTPTASGCTGMMCYVLKASEICPSGHINRTEQPRGAVHCCT